MNINELVKACHENAIEKGFYECPECDGVEKIKDENNNHTGLIPCPNCNGSGINPDRNISELLMLIVSELGEAQEALRKNLHQFVQIENIIKTKTEKWKPVLGYEDEYEISNIGRVRSLDMQVWNGKKYYSKDGRILKAGLSGTGYYTVSLKGKTQKISWLVCEAFYGSREGKIINHINGDKKCDWVTNLEYTDYPGNNQHAIDNGLKDMNKKLSYFDKVNIALRIKSGEKMTDIHKDYNFVHISTIKNLKYRGIDKYTDSFEIEIADTFIRLFDLCGYLNIDIEKHIEAKMKYNESRPRKHGKEF